MKIEIITHCWAKTHPHFAAALHYQLSSLILHKPKNAEVQVVVCAAMEDENTARVLDKFLGIDGFWRYSMSPEELGRRSIGRNCLALTSQDDLVWFTDCDHVFHEGCLDALAAMPWPQGASMIYPKRLMIHKDHATGDVALQKPVDGLLDINPADFVEKTYNRAIGGVQIVQGDFARQHGYLSDDSKWQQPTGKPFSDFHDDIAYRKFCLQYGPIVGVEIPSLFRIRHSTTSYQ